MNANELFYMILIILWFEFLLNQLLGYLNYTWYWKTPDESVSKLYDEEEYVKSQKYKSTVYKFSVVQGAFSILTTTIFLYMDGFEWVDEIARSMATNDINVALIFFVIIGALGELTSLPFSLYFTFKIEQDFGFNKTSIRTFCLDKLKGWTTTAIIGAVLLSALIFLYQELSNHFWYLAWGIIAIFIFILNLFYAQWIVPLFNKQALIEEGELKNAITSYALKVSFNLKKIFVIDGSKRSTKANAYFSGMGSQKRITLYDTLINDLDNDEIVAVLAHEVGHYKKKHIITNLILSIANIGVVLFVFSTIMDSQLLSQALGVQDHSFHIGFIAFGLLYAPLSMVTGVLMSMLSRKFEFQADQYAAQTYHAKPLINALKKLSKNNLSNLTPHPWYVFVNYSHPPLYQRIKNLENL